MSDRRTALVSRFAVVYHQLKSVLPFLCRFT